MSETVLFDEEGVKIMPGTMTVAHNYRSDMSVTQVERFSLTDVTVIRCVEKEESDFITFCAQIFNAKFLILLLIGGLLTQVPIGLVIWGIDTKDYVFKCSIYLLLYLFLSFLFWLGFAFSGFCRQKKHPWAVWVVTVAAYFVSFQLLRWGQLGIIALGLCLAGTVYCAWVGAKVFKCIWLNIELLHGSKTTVCYKANLGDVTGARAEETLAKCNRIMDALNRAISTQ